MTGNVRKMTPVLLTEEVEPCVKFWTERLGFAKTVEVPEGDRLGFVILQNDNLEIMYQSFASAMKDTPTLAADVHGGRTFLYVEVAKLDAVLAAMKDMFLVLPVRYDLLRGERIWSEGSGGARGGFRGDGRCVGQVTRWSDLANRVALGEPRHPQRFELVPFLFVVGVGEAASAVADACFDSTGDDLSVCLVMASFGLA
jgi:hypothetical protein